MRASVSGRRSRENPSAVPRVEPDAARRVARAWDGVWWPSAALLWNAIAPSRRGNRS